VHRAAFSVVGRLLYRIIINLGVRDVVEGGLKIVETADGVTEDELRAATLAKIVN
jgi:3-oxoacid CoA-transferase subunit B